MSEIILDGGAEFVSFDEITSETNLKLIQEAIAGTTTSMIELFTMIKINALETFKIDDYIVICEKLQEKNIISLMIWVMVSADQTGKNFGKMLNIMDKVALKSGCNSINFRTKRKGFEKKLPKSWQLQAYWWAKDLTKSNIIYH